MSNSHMMPLFEVLCKRDRVFTLDVLIFATAAKKCVQKGRVKYMSLSSMFVSETERRAYNISHNLHIRITLLKYF